MAQTPKPNFQIPDSLTHSAGDITAVFGSNSFMVEVSTLLSTNTLHFLYIRDTGAGAELLVETDVPSVYQATHSDAILVGAFYTWGQAGPTEFGSFININGVPQTEIEINFTPGILGAGTVTINGFTWKRNGRFSKVWGVFTAGTPTGVALEISTPIGQTLNRPFQTTVLGEAGSNYTGAEFGALLPFMLSAGNEFFFSHNESRSIVNAVNGNQVLVPGSIFYMNAEFPVIGWDDASLKDL